MTTGAVATGGIVHGAPVTRPAADGADADADWQVLPAATLRLWQLDNVVGLLVACSVLGVLVVVGRPPALQPWLLPLAGLALVAAVVEGALVLPRRHRSYRYRVTTGSVVVESGAVVLHQLVVPLHQVLYVETRQGPVQRAYGLTHVRLGTIADLKSVGPLSTGAAEGLRRAVEAARPPSEQAGPR